VTINLETLRAELHAEIEKLHDEIDRRCDAATQKKADVEPPVCSEALLAHIERGVELGTSDYKKAASEIRYLRAELARLREGLKSQVRDVTQGWIESWKDDASEAGAAAREIQRHRRLVQP
jgi:hypothetical protein